MPSTLFCLSFLSPLAQADDDPPKSRNEIVCSDLEKTIGLNEQLTKEGLLRRGLPELTTYCLADIETVNQACAKSKGVKRRLWCGLISEYCKTLSQADEKLYQRRVETQKEDNERMAREQRNGRAKREQMGANLPSSDRLVMGMIENLSELSINLTSNLPIQRETLPASCTVPEQEDIVKKRQAEYLKNHAFVPTGPMFDSSSTPSFMPWPAARHASGDNYLCQACQRDKAFACSKTSGPTASDSAIVSSHWAMICAKDCSQACGGF